MGDFKEKHKKCLRGVNWLGVVTSIWFPLFFTTLNTMLLAIDTIWPALLVKKSVFREIPFFSHK
jgi:hypothetical protein